MCNKFISDLLMVFGKTEDDFSETVDSAVFYLFDSENPHRTFITNKKENDSSIEVSNPHRKKIIHIPVDGGIIPWGEEYDPTYKKRPECMIITDDLLVFIELKMNVTTIIDKQIWQKCNEALAQIKEFILFLRNKIILPYMNPKAYIGIPKIPQMNAQRINNLVKFKNETNVIVDFIDKNRKLII